MNSETLRRLLAPVLALLVLVAIASPAAASPGAYTVLIVWIGSDRPEELRQQIAAEPGVAAVDLFETSDAAGVPSPAQLAAYDLVVDAPAYFYPHPVAYGNALADYLDAGGVLVQFAYDTWVDGAERAGPHGRFESGGYAPLLHGPNLNDPLTLGSFDAASPLMQGVGPLASGDNTAPALAPGATLVAQWTNGVNAIAHKGNVVSSSAYPGEKEIDGSGSYGRLAVNAVRWLGRQTLTIANLNPARGTVVGSGGLLCGTVCSTFFSRNTPVSLTAAPNRKFAFAGFGGDCTGAVCNLTMSAPRAVSANFVTFGTDKKVKTNKRKGTALLSFGIGGPGEVVLSGRKVRQKGKSPSEAGRVKLPILAKGKALKALRANGKAKVKVQVAFTPVGGSTAVFAKKVTLRRSAAG
ncbi:MAG TPA: hypothetical protein VD741_08625 [Solirubrobacterales bacterium]|nr:hypothetical protein [Solirubrobacterales bacterium]